MVNLDDPSAYGKYDLSGMLEHIRLFHAQLLDGWKGGAAFKLPAGSTQADKVIIAGMGGSAIGGEVLGNLLAMGGAIPVWIHRDFGLPHFVDAKTLVITVSYSGNTEETLSAYHALTKTSAMKAVLTSGGKLADLARKHGVPVAVIHYRSPPRAAFPYMLGALVGILSGAGILSYKTGDLEKTSTALQRMAKELDIGIRAKSNHAKQLATELCGRIPVIYGEGALSGVARRWKTQFNENSKNWAFFEVFPELVHNAIAGHSVPTWARERLFVILLRAPLFNERMKMQYNAVIELLSKEKIPHKVIDADGNSLLTQVLGTVLLGDFTSYYLAIMNEVDPTPLPTVDYVKSRMAESTDNKG